jgi:hypothetical protein
MNRRQIPDECDFSLRVRNFFSDSHHQFSVAPERPSVTPPVLSVPPKGGGFVPLEAVRVFRA